MINIEDFLNDKKLTSKQEIAELTGLNERVVRKKISDLKLVKPVIYNSHKKGYRLAKKIEEMTKEELQKEVKLIEHCIADIQARKKVFDKQLRTYIAYLKIADKHLI